MLEDELRLLLYMNRSVVLSFHINQPSGPHYTSDFSMHFLCFVYNTLSSHCYYKGMYTFHISGWLIYQSYSTIERINLYNSCLDYIS